MSNANPSLRVETFEAFMLAGDSDEFPMSFVFEFEFDGQVDPARLNDAIAKCAPRHPLLFSTLDASQQRWLIQTDLIPSVKTISPVEAQDYHQALRFDLESEVGLKVTICDPEGANQKVGFVFHHACVDGIGAFQLIQDVSKVYRGDSVSTDAKADAMLAVSYLKKFRDSSGGNRLLHWLRWPLDLLGMLWSFEMLFNHPQPIEVGKQASVGGAKSFGQSTETVQLLLAAAETVSVKQLSKSANQTINDRVIESVFLAIESWNTKFNPESCGEMIRLMVPMNLRRKPSLSAANMVAMVNFDRKVGRWKSASQFRKWLRLEMGVVKRIRAGVTANRFLKLQRLLIGQWPMQKKTDQCLATTLVSNLGDVSRLFNSGSKYTASQPIQFGDLNVKSLKMITPLRPNSNVFICLFTYAGQLNFNVTFNSRLLQRQHVEDLLDSVKSHLLNALAFNEGSGSEP